MTGIPWNDASGERLRQWMNVDRRTFYDESLVAIIPMGYCYPGKGDSGDLPPRRECAPRFVPLPHPSPRNQPWFKRPPWFEQQVIPALQACVQSLIANTRSCPIRSACRS